MTMETPIQIPWCLKFINSSQPCSQDAAVITLGIRALSETCTAAAISPYLAVKQKLKGLERSVDIRWFRCNNNLLEKIEDHRTS